MVKMNQAREFYERYIKTRIGYTPNKTNQIDTSANTYSNYTVKQVKKTKASLM